MESDFEEAYNHWMEDRPFSRKQALLIVEHEIEPLSRRVSVEGIMKHVFSKCSSSFWKEMSLTKKMEVKLFEEAFLLSLKLKIEESVCPSESKEIKQIIAEIKSSHI